MVITEKKVSQMNHIRIYVDGACSGNPGPGGFGILIKEEGKPEQAYAGAESQTTNNRMELTAAIEGLRLLPPHPHRVDVYTDSQYVKKGITEWLSGWVKRGWRNSRGEAVKNQDLWQALVHETMRHQVEWHWVKAHNGHRENEIVDSLARDAIDALRNGT